MKRELAELRAKVDSVGQLVGFSLLQQRSTSERLQTVLATLDEKNPNQKVLGNLIGALALDPECERTALRLGCIVPACRPTGGSFWRACFCPANKTHSSR